MLFLSIPPEGGAVDPTQLTAGGDSAEVAEDGEDSTEALGGTDAIGRGWSCCCCCCCCW